MFYENELNFFRNVIERSKIKTVIITKTEIPPKIDMGICEITWEILYKSNKKWKKLEKFAKNTLLSLGKAL